MSDFQTRPFYFHSGDLQHFHAVPRDARKTGRRALYNSVVALILVSCSYCLCHSALRTIPPLSPAWPFTLARPSVATVSRTGPSCGSVIVAASRSGDECGGSAINTARYLGPLTTRYDAVTTVVIPDRLPTSRVPPHKANSERRPKTYNARHHFFQPLDSRHGGLSSLLEPIETLQTRKPHPHAQRHPAVPPQGQRNNNLQPIG